MADPDPLIGKRLGVYRIDAKLGAGGMGDVYRATHETLGREFAIKTLKPNVAASDVMLERFFAEARVVSKIAHDNIIDVTHLQKAERLGEPSYMVMELLEGQTLTQAIRRVGKVEPKRCAFIAVQVADAIGAAHEKGVVHRDLKPDNVFLIRRFETPDYVKVLDFGIARLRPEMGGSGATKTGAVLGTPAYMSPEQAKGEAVTGAADIYALGIIMFQMLTGRLPFEGPSMPEIMYGHISMEPPPVHKLSPHVPPRLANLVARMLAKDPGERPDTMRRVRYELLDALGIDPNASLATLSSLVSAAQYDSRAGDSMWRGETVDVTGRESRSPLVAGSGAGAGPAAALAAKAAAGPASHGGETVPGKGQPTPPGSLHTAHGFAGGSTPIEAITPAGPAAGSAVASAMTPMDIAGDAAAWSGDTAYPYGTAGDSVGASSEWPSAAGATPYSQAGLGSSSIGSAASMGSAGSMAGANSTAGAGSLAGTPRTVEATSAPPRRSVGRRRDLIIAVAAAMLAAGGVAGYSVMKGGSSSDVKAAGSGGDAVTPPVEPDSPSSRASFDQLVRRQGEPIAPGECQTDDDALLTRLIDAAGRLRDGKPGGARPEDREAVSILTDEAAAAEYWYWLGKARLYAGAGSAEDSAAVQEAAARALQSCPSYAAAHGLRGTALFRGKNVADAEKEFRRALELQPDFAAARYNLGLVQLQTGRVTDAIDAFTQVIEQDPDDARALTSRALAYMASKRDDDAMADLAKAEALDPAQAAEGLWILAQASARQGQSDKANRAMCRAAKLGHAEAASKCHE